MKAWIFAPVFLGLSACGEVGFPDFRGLGGGADQAAQAPDKERLASAIEANGCAIDTTNVATILLQASIDATASEAVMTELVQEGRLVEAGAETLRLTSPNCI